jgi:hypothetical protein
MRDFHDAKAMAKSLRTGLAVLSMPVSHSQALELIATAFGEASWHVLSARVGETVGEDAVRFEAAIPIIRIFDLAKAKDFYVGLLGMSIDWEHRFEDGYPLYMQVSRGALVLHLSEHHGDATPGSNAYIRMRGLDAFHAELRARGSHAGIEDGPGNTRVLQLWDPFANRLRFAEAVRAR